MNRIGCNVCKANAFESPVAVASTKSYHSPLVRIGDGKKQYRQSVYSQPGVNWQASSSESESAQRILTTGLITWLLLLPEHADLLGQQHYSATKTRR